MGGSLKRLFELEFAKHASKSARWPSHRSTLDGSRQSKSIGRLRAGAVKGKWPTIAARFDSIDAAGQRPSPLTVTRIVQAHNQATTASLANYVGPPNTRDHASVIPIKYIHKSGAGRNFCRAWLENRMDRRSTEGVSGEWRKQGVSGQLLCRSSIGAACGGGRFDLQRWRQKNSSPVLL